MKFIRSDGFVLLGGAIIGIALLSIYAVGVMKLIEYLN